MWYCGTSLLWAYRLLEWERVSKSLLFTTVNTYVVKYLIQHILDCQQI